MMQRIQFRCRAVLDFDTGKRHLQRIKVRRGERLSCKLRPHVIQLGGDLVEVADLQVNSGTLLNVPYRAFFFVNNPQ